MSETPPTRNPKRQRKKEGAAARRAAQVAALRRQQRNRRITRIAILAVVAVLVLVGISVFGNDDDGDETDLAADETTTTTVAEEGTTTTAAPVPATPMTCAGPTGENTDLTQKPTVTVPDAPATELQCVDLVVGDGEEVTASNDVVQVHYVGVAQSNGQEFDTSWGSEPVSFGLDGVISGWTEGIPGMKVGGRRMLTIPGDKAYGPTGNPGAGIGPDDTLVFVIDLLDVNPEP